MPRFVLAAFSFLAVVYVAAALDVASGTGSSVRAIAKSKYTTAHSLGDSYTFDARDGWQSFNASDLAYKYRRAKPNSAPPKNQGVVSKLLAAFAGLGGIGEANKAIITWYTGHDLENPSCWPNTKWKPTDKSFCCATTLVGWKNKPKCFDFVEVCNGHSKCTFCRIVDTCAGCAKASHHLDMTQAAFTQLASLDEGLLTVQMRPATQPKEWHEDLWGPEV
ncbi:DPBB-1 domain-containing protein [Mycena kentingensis (nom. inval.)]|nr:DPBB-1 domain-containing protein [Mycena kentingensis (nom. inval.)]